MECGLLLLGKACGVCENEDTVDSVDGKRTMPILVADDVKGVFLFLARMVLAKRPTERVVKWCCSSLEDPGYAGSEVTVKT